MRPKIGAFILIAIVFFCVYLVKTRLFLPEPVPKAAGTISTPDSAGARLVFGEPLDINSASAKDLALLPGIGGKLSSRIVEDREKGGGYGSIDELSRVRGLSPWRLKRVANYITAGG
jgi:DNA uptake protein ComE-like DNA-binding protein